MRRGFARPEVQYEFELDLAPLLAVMVKLVPVMLITSSFVTLTQLSTDIPQTVKELIEQNKAPESNKLQVYLDGDAVTINMTNDPKGTTKVNVSELRHSLEEIKTKNPEMFVMYLNPSPNTTHSQILQVMDLSRRLSPGKSDIEFTNPKTGKSEKTRFLFPEVVLANSMDG